MTEFIANLISKIPTGLGIFDVTDGIINLVYINDGYYNMIDAQRDDRTQYLGTGTINPIHPDDRFGLLTEVKVSILEKRLFNHKFRVLNGYGSYTWIGISASHDAINDKTERFYASYYSVDNYVTEQNRLQSYGNNLDTILGNIPGGVAIFSERNGVLQLDYTNAGFYVLHHGSREYWSKQSSDPVNWLTPEDRHIFYDEFRDVNNGIKESGSVVYRIVGEDGGLHWVSNQFKPAYKQDGAQYYYASFIDMDKQIADENEIRSIKQVYDDATKSSKMTVWTYDIEQHCVNMLQAGYTAEICAKYDFPQIISNVPESLAVYIDSEDRATFIKAYHDIDNGADRAECEIRFKFPQQSELQYEHFVLKRIYDENGRLLTVYCCGLNVTEQKHMERKYEEAYRQLDKAHPHSLGSFHLNLTKNTCGGGTSPFKFVLEQQRPGTVDGYFEEFSKLIADETVKKDFFARFDRKLLLQEFAKGRTEESIEYPIVYADGKRHWRQGLLFMLSNPSTGDVEAVTYAVDIDDIKQNEFVMNRLIHDHFDYIGIIHPTDRTFEFISRRPWVKYEEIGKTLDYDKCCEYVRYKFNDNEESRRFDEAVSLDNILQDLRINGHRSVSYTRTENGRIFCSRLQYNWLEQKDGDILVVRTDVTDTYTKEQQNIADLKQAMLAADAANKAKSEFLSSMSHDIRTPLNGIIGMTRIAKEHNNSSETADALNKIDMSAEFLLGLVNDVLDMSKIESGQVKLLPEPNLPEECFNYIESVIRPLADRKKQKLYITGFTNNEYIPLMDKLRTHQLMFNLLSNSVKYTQEGGRIEYHHEDRMVGNKMEIVASIIDNGCGMSEEFQKQLFQPYTQEDRVRSMKDMNSGTGLGLAIVKKIIDMMDGTIEVKSKINEGTTFTIHLLVDTIKRSEYVAEDIEKNVEVNKHVLKNKKILVCEDNKINQEIVQSLLEEEGIIVTIADDGFTGKQLFEDSSIGLYDCILMDIRMPIMDGYEVTQAIRSMKRADSKTVPIIAMTADAYEDDKKKCLDVGMNDHVAKPLNPLLLFSTLTKFIQEKDKKS
jgi:signal transduction histidine kinase/PAS domain-containing protein